MDSTKTAIKSLVLELRKSLEADIEVGLRRYGITPTALRPLDSLKHLDDRGITARIRMEEAIHHEMERSTDSKQTLAEAVHWFVREVAFTHLNRLVGLKAMEVRGLIPEVIQTRAEYGNRSRVLRDYREAHPEAASLPDDGLEDAIKEACRQVYPEFRLLFDVGDPAEMRDAPTNSLLFPSTPTLKACISSINELDTKIGRSGAPAHGKATPEQSMWAEDEIIGWVYQFYNAEEKVTIRDKGKPKHPSEVAVINQFFTPRWIIKFLVDNTLGRLWLEMHPDSSKVRTKCDYLVPEPAPTGSEGLDPDSPINNPEAAPRRGAKRPQDIRLIDPACGTMHFGHYAFEVFQEIYADARERGWVKGADALSDADVPAAILQNNLFGVDIDLRAVQLAALSLFMKAKSANPDVHVGQVNLIVADAHLPQGKVRTDFLAQYASEPVIQKAFEEVFESLDNVAEVGSLLRVEERFRQALSSGGFQSKTPAKKKKDADGQQAAFAEIAPGWSMEHTVEQMLGHLREFARRALQEHDINAQLFATEAEKSVALLDVFLHNYDVVVMNPPYGESTADAKEELKKLYKITGNDLYAAFIERATDFLIKGGYGGALTSRTFLYLSSFQDLREKVLLKHAKPLTILDLGFGILDDAMVETCATVFSTFNTNGVCEFIRVNNLEDREKVLRTALNMNASDEKKLRYQIPLKEFEYLPRTPFSYWASSSMRRLFEKFPSFEPAAGIVRQGKATGDDGRFVRFCWEVMPGNDRWKPFAKGGDYSKYYYFVDLVLDWSSDAQKAHAKMGNALPNKQHYFREGLTYPRVTVKGFNVRYLESGAIFADKGPAIFLENLPSSSLWYLLAMLNSSMAQALLLMMTPSRSFEVGHVSRLPILIPNDEVKKKISNFAQEAYQLKAQWDTGNEVNLKFTMPWLLQSKLGNLLFSVLQDANKNTSQLKALVDNVLEVESIANKKIQQLQKYIDATIFELHKISKDDIALIEQELGERPPELVWAYSERFKSDQKATEHVARLMSFCLIESIKSDPDGILPMSEDSGGTNALRQIQTQLETHFGEQVAYQVELDSAAYLGRPLGEWLLKNFWKDFHVKWYKNRPLLWQLQSQKGHFACILHIHKLDRDTLPKIRTQYLWSARNACQANLESARLREDAGDRSAAKEVAKLESMLEDLNDFEQRLTSVIEGRVKCKIPAWAQGPYRNGIYDPVLDDGVAVNILPLQEAGLLAKAKVV